MAALGSKHQRGGHPVTQGQPHVRPTLQQLRHHLGIPARCCRHERRARVLHIQTRHDHTRGEHGGGAYKLELHCTHRQERLIDVGTTHTQ